MIYTAANGHDDIRGSSCSRFRILALTLSIAAALMGGRKGLLPRHWSGCTLLFVNEPWRLGDHWSCQMMKTHTLTLVILNLQTNTSVSESSTILSLSESHDSDPDIRFLRCFGNYKERLHDGRIGTDDDRTVQWASRPSYSTTMSSMKSSWIQHRSKGNNFYSFDESSLRYQNNAGIDVAFLKAGFILGSLRPFVPFIPCTKLRLAIIWKEGR